MFTLVTPSLAAGRYSLGSTPIEPAILPPRHLMRSTSSLGTLELPCMTSGNRQPAFDLGEHVEVEGLSSLELEGAVAGANGAGQRIASRIV